MALSLSIKHRLLVSHLFAVVVLAGAFGAFVYYMAAQQVVERLHAQLSSGAALIAQSFDPAGLDSAARDPAARRADRSAHRPAQPARDDGNARSGRGATQTG